MELRWRRFINNQIFNILLLFVVIFSIININLYKNIAVLDIALILFLIVLGGFSKIRKETSIFLLISNIGLVVSLFLMYFSNNHLESIFFILQLFLIVNIVPTFFEIVMFNKKNKTLEDMLLYVVIGVSLMFFVFAILHFAFGYNSFLFFSMSGIHRISFGDSLVSNDLGYYFVLAVFLVQRKFKNKNIKYLILMFLTLTYFLTLSKTILVIIVFFWMRYFFSYWKYLIPTLGVLVMLVVLLDINIPRIDRLTNSFDNKIGYSQDSRVLKIKGVVENASSFFYTPLYNQNDNAEFKNTNNVQSVHNVILSLIVNIGWIPTLIILFIPLVLIIYLLSVFRNVQSKGILFYVFLLFFVMSVNAFMVTRCVWIVVFFFIYTFIYDNVKQKKNIISSYECM